MVWITHQQQPSERQPLWEEDGTGILYYRARYYDPTLQAFISQDPLGDTQRYANENPISNTDPLGLEVGYIYRNGIPHSTLDPVRTQCSAECLTQVSGLSGLSMAGIAAGQPIIPKPFVTPGAAEGTSFASIVFRSLFPGARFPFRIPFLGTSSVGGAIGRTVPYAGMAGLGIAGYQFQKCLSECVSNKQPCSK